MFKKVVELPAISELSVKPKKGDAMNRVYFLGLYDVVWVMHSRSCLLARGAIVHCAVCVIYGASNMEPLNSSPSFCFFIGKLPIEQVIF